MKNIGPDRTMIYRDSKTWYADISNTVATSEWHVGFIKKYAGRKVLDLGCATGKYGVELKRFGFEWVGADINEKYVEMARRKGLESHTVSGTLPFVDRSFDTVIMIEVLEHVTEPKKILDEASRVARKNILITVPDCAGFEELRSGGLTYEHFLEIDHVNFFTKDSLKKLLSGYSDDVKVGQARPIRPWLFREEPFPKGILSVIIRKTVSFSVRLGLLRPKYYTSLYAVVTLRDINGK